MSLDPQSGTEPYSPRSDGPVPEPAQDTQERLEEEMTAESPVGAQMSLETPSQPVSIGETPEISDSTLGETGNRPPNAITCARCDSWWTGMLTSHCSACHRTFTGLTAFDAHRDGNHATSTRHCVDPETVGLIVSDRKYVCWGFPSDGTQWWKK